KLAEAAPHFRQAGQLEPKYAEFLLELAALYEKNRQPEEAIAIYREFPNNAAAQRQMAQLMMASRQYAEAIPELESAFAKSATQPNRVALAKAYLLARQLDKAIPLFNEAVAAEPDNYDLRMMYALALRDRKQFPAAAAQFLQAARIHPQEA